MNGNVRKEEASAQLDSAKKRLLELTSDDSGIADEWRVSFEASEQALALIKRVIDAGYERPGIFPAGDHGSSLEWSTQKYIASITISPEGSSYELYSNSEGKPSTAIETSDIDEAFRFVSQIHTTEGALS